MAMSGAHAVENVLRTTKHSALRAIGNTGVSVSQLGLNCWMMGERNDAAVNDVSPWGGDHQALDTVHAAAENEIRLFNESASMGCGLAGQRLGLALQNHRRQQMGLISAASLGLTAEPDFTEKQTSEEKGIQLWSRDSLWTYGVPEESEFRLVADISALGLKGQLRDVMCRTGLTQRDLYCMEPVFTTSEAVTEFKATGGLEVFESLKAEKKAKALGYIIPLLESDEMVAYLERILNVTKPDFVIAPYNLMLASQTEKLLNLCDENEVPVIATSPFDGGVLSQAALEGVSFRGADIPAEVVQSLKNIYASRFAKFCMLKTFRPQQ